MRLPAGMALRDLGTHRFPDHGDECVFQLLAPGLPDEFPPLGVSTSRPGRLPAPAEPAGGPHGRTRPDSRAPAAPRRARADPDRPGGVGKTRLALRSPSDLGGDVRRRRLFVDLAPLAIPPWSHAASPRPSGSKSRRADRCRERLRRYSARSAELLLVLDNFEHVLDAAPLVAELLSACPSLKVLVTSRAPLHLPGEHEFPVPPLALPDAAARRRRRRRSPSPAVRLFVERAQAVRPDFALTTTNAAAVAGDLPAAGRAAAGDRAGRRADQMLPPHGPARPAGAAAAAADRRRARRCRRASRRCATPSPGATTC